MPPAASSPGSRSCRHRRRVRRHPHLPRLDPGAALGEDEIEDNLDLDHARDPRRGPLRPREGQGTNHRVPRRLQAQERPLGADPVLVGPPGAGSARPRWAIRIASALGRKFVRISVGGVREAEIRGHRRTYIGAAPWIIRAIRDAETMNPVFLIDEIDKMGADYRGDPASAMLEAPTRSSTPSFRDHYLDLPFDRASCSSARRTARNDPAPLLDRMDVINLSGYTEAEKFSIARRYLVPKQPSRRTGSRNSRRDQRRGDPRRDPRAHARGRLRATRATARGAVPQGRTRSPRAAPGGSRSGTSACASGSGRAGCFYEVRKRTAEPGAATARGHACRR